MSRRHPVAAAIAAAVLLAAGSVAPAAATGVGGATWTPSEIRATSTAAGYRVTRDSIYVFVWMRWDRAGIRALRDYEADGLRYTQEVNDLSGRLSATGFFVTDLPGAAYDRDDDDGDGRWEEVEVTVSDAGALRAGRRYYAGFQFTRWTQRCDDGMDPACWDWNRRGGDLAVLSQLSRYFFGEWQAERWTNPYVMLRYDRMPDPLRDE